MNNISDGYYGRTDNSPNLNQLFDSVDRGVQYGMNVANAIDSRRYTNQGYPSFEHPQAIASSPYSNYNRQRSYRVPNLDMYGWGPGRGTGTSGVSLSKYPGIWMESYGSGGRI